MNSPDTIIDRAQSAKLVRAVDRVPKGHLRIETYLQYPDGSSIEVFVPWPEMLVSKRISDFGQTMAALLQMQVKPTSSTKRRSLFEETLRQFGVVQSGGALEAPYETSEDLGGAITRLAQACFRVSDLSFTRRPATLGSFDERFEEFLSDLEVPYELGALLEIGRDRAVKVDFLVSRPKIDAAILTLSTGSQQQAHNRSNEIFTRWYDLEQAGRIERRITVFDDGYDVYAPRDLDRLAGISTLVPASDRAAMAESLLAA